MDKYFKALVLLFGSLFVATVLHFWLIWMVVSLGGVPDVMAIVIFDLSVLGMSLIIIGSQIFKD